MWAAPWARDISQGILGWEICSSIVDDVSLMRIPNLWSLSPPGAVGRQGATPCMTSRLQAERGRLRTAWAAAAVPSFDRPGKREAAQAGLMA